MADTEQAKKDLVSLLMSKIQKQRNEIGRLTKLVEDLQADKKALFADLKYWQDEYTALAKLTAQSRKDKPGTPLPD